MSRSVIVYSLVLGLGILGMCAGLSTLERRAHAENGIPDCEDGIDNDGDGLVDFPADPGCSSPQDTSEIGGANDGGANDGGALDGGAQPSDGGAHQFDLSLADLSPTSGATDLGGQPGVVDAGDGGSTYTNPGSTTVTGTGTASTVQRPIGQGCDLGEGALPTAPIVIVLSVACALVLTRRPEL